MYKRQVKIHSRNLRGEIDRRGASINLAIDFKFSFRTTEPLIASAEHHHIVFPERTDDMVSPIGPQDDRLGGEDNAIRPGARTVTAEEFQPSRRAEWVPFEIRKFDAAIQFHTLPVS